MAADVISRASTVLPTVAPVWSVDHFCPLGVTVSVLQAARLSLAQPPQGPLSLQFLRGGGGALTQVYLTAGPAPPLTPE